MSDTKKKGHTRCAVDIPDLLNKRVERFMEANATTSSIPNSKRAFMLECIRVGFEQISEEQRDQKNAETAV